MCPTCRFFESFGASINGVIGLCRRHAPRPSVTIWVDHAEQDAQGPGSYQVDFPPVDDEDWCGEHLPVPVEIRGGPSSVGGDEG